MQFSTLFFTSCFAVSRIRVGTLSSSSGAIVQCSAGQLVLYLVSVSAACEFAVCLWFAKNFGKFDSSCLGANISIWHLFKQTSQSECFINYNSNKMNNNNNLNFNCVSNSNCILYLCLLLLHFIVCLSCLRVNFHFHLAFEFAFATDKLWRMGGGGCGRGSAHSSARYSCCCCCRCQIYSQLKLPLMHQRAHSALCELHHRHHLHRWRWRRTGKLSEFLRANWSKNCLNYCNFQCQTEAAAAAATGLKLCSN